MKIQLAKPDITEQEINAVAEVMRSGILSIGRAVERFEAAIANYTGTKHAVAVNSGTSGLHLLIRAFGIKDEDEVITTPFSFVASANCILYERAKPVFTDIDPATYSIDIGKLADKITGKTKAILAVDVFGHPADMDKLREIAWKYGLKLIEDSCEALGSEYNGIKCGSRADGAVFAFYPNKQITTGEGGMIVTNDDDTAKTCQSLRNQGRGSMGVWLEHERLGYNYRMSELNAALGSVQMERLESIIDKRNHVAGMYKSRLERLEGVVVPYVDNKVTRMSWFVYVVRLKGGICRNTIMQYLLDNGVSCRPYFSPIHLQKYYRELFGYKQGDFPVTEAIAASTIALPFYNDITEEQVDYVVRTLKEGIEKYETKSYDFKKEYEGC